MSTDRKRALRWWHLVPLALGVALFGAVVYRHGSSGMLEAIALLQWALVLVATVHLLPLCADALGWRALFVPAERPTFRQALLWRWIGQSVSVLLPSAQVGGDVVRARLATLSGWSLQTTAGSVVWDILVGILTQIGFALLGLTLLLHQVGGLPPPDLAPALLGGVVIMAGAVLAGLAFLRAKVLTRFATLARRASWLGALPGAADDLDAELRRTLRRRAALAAAAAWRLAGWLLGACEVWLGFHLLGYPVTWFEALLVESIVQTARTAAFLIPGALGVQEMVLILLGASLGVPPEGALALSILKRFRELVLGLPGLLSWQLIEGRRLSGRAARRGVRSEAV